MADALVSDSLRKLLRFPAGYFDTPARHALLVRASFPTRMGGLKLPKLLLGEADLAHVAAFAAAPPKASTPSSSPLLRTLRPYVRVAQSLQEVPEDMAWGHSLREARRAITPLLRLPPDDVATLRTAAPVGPPSIKCGVRLNRSRPWAVSGVFTVIPEWRDAYADIASLRVPSTTATWPSAGSRPGLQSKLSRANALARTSATSRTSRLRQTSGKPLDYCRLVGEESLLPSPTTPSPSTTSTLTSTTTPSPSTTSTLSSTTSPLSETPPATSSFQI